MLHLCKGLIMWPGFNPWMQNISLFPFHAIRNAFWSFSFQWQYCSPLIWPMNIETSTGCNGCDHIFRHDYVVLTHMLNCNVDMRCMWCRNDEREWWLNSFDFWMMKFVRFSNRRNGATDRHSERDAWSHLKIFMSHSLMSKPFPYISLRWHLGSNLAS